MSTAPYRHAIIGTGRPRGTEGATGFGMAHPHYTGFKATGSAYLAAIADIDEGHARAFLADYGETCRSTTTTATCCGRRSPTSQHHRLAPPSRRNDHCRVRGGRPRHPLREADGDDVGGGAAYEGGGPCERHCSDLQSSASFLEPIQSRADDSRRRAGRPAADRSACNDLFDTGTHWLDMMQFFNQDTPVEWVSRRLTTAMRTHFWRAGRGSGGLPLQMGERSDAA